MRHLTILVLFVALAGLAPAATRYVKVGGAGTQDGLSVANAASSIATAVGAAVSSDTVLVATGTYQETASPVILVDGVQLIGGWNATFTTSSPLTAPSVIDGQNLRSGLRVGNTASSVAPSGFKIAGFSFINCAAIGDLTANLDRGGGIGIHWTTANGVTGTISKCTFTNCTATNGGAAIWTGVNTGASGTALGTPASHYITIEDCTVTNCSSPAAATGGGAANNGTGQQSVAVIWTQRSGGQPRTIVRRCVIKDCIAPNNGIVFTNVNSTNELEFTDNLVVNCQNTKAAASGDGGLLFFGGRNSSIFANNTIVNCSAPNYFISHDTNNATGAQQTNTIVFANNIFANNTITGFSGGANSATVSTLIIQRSNNNVATAPNCVFKKNLFFNNKMADNSAIANIFGSANGTNLLALVAADNFVDLDPKFVSSTDFHVQSGSPALNTGIASAVTLDAVPQTVNIPAFDLDGKTRPLGAAFDIGAYEVQPPNAAGNWTLY